MANNFWNELPFHSGTCAIPPYRQIFMGDGKEDFSRWCRRFEVSVSANPDTDDNSLAKILPTCLGGAAFSYWDSLPEAIKSDFTATKEKLKSVFGQTAYLSTFQSYINARSRNQGEALPVFAAEIARLVDDAFPTYGDNAKNGEKFRRFIAGLDPYLQLRCHEQGVKTLEEALQFAMQIEAAHQASTLFAASGPTQFCTTNPVYPAISFVSPTPQPAPTLLGVNSANTDEMKKMLKTIETLSDKVEQLQLAVDRQQKGEHGSGFRRRSSTPEGRRRDRYADGYYESPPPGRNSYDHNHSSRRTSRSEEEEYHQDQRTRSGSSERFHRGYNASQRDSNPRGRSPDRYAGGYSRRSPSPGRVRFQSPSRPRSNQVNYQ